MKKAVIIIPSVLKEKLKPSTLVRVRIDVIKEDTVEIKEGLQAE